MCRLSVERSEDALVSARDGGSFSFSSFVIRSLDSQKKVVCSKFENPCKAGVLSAQWVSFA